MARKAKRTERRKRGTGIIRHRKGRAQPYQTEWQHADGSCEYRGFQERAEAERWLDGLVAKRKKGQSTTAGAQTLETLIKKWLTIRAAKNPAPKTFLCYKFYGEIIAGQIGSERIDTLTLEHMEVLCAYLVKAHFQNIRALFSMLAQIFKYARVPSLRWMTEDPLEGLQIPKVKRRVNQILTEEQRDVMLEVARRDDNPSIPLFPLWHLYSRFGLRKGEGIALLWTDVDWQAKTLTIDESISNVGPDNLKGLPKGDKIRVIPLPDDMVEMLREHQRAQQKRGIFPSIFADAHGEIITPQHVQYRWAKLRKAAQCPRTTIHDLRHTALYLMALAGIPENIRMALAGHSTAEMARLYSEHATLEDVRRHVG